MSNPRTTPLSELRANILAALAVIIFVVAGACIVVMVM